MMLFCVYTLTEYILFACIYPIITSLYSPSLYFLFKSSVRKSSVRMPPFFTIHMNVLSFYTIGQGDGVRVESIQDEVKQAEWKKMK